MAMPQPRLCILEAIGPRVASARMKRHDSRLPGHSSIRHVGCRQAHDLHHERASHELP
jgi:hypothetical protein